MRRDSKAVVMVAPKTLREKFTQEREQLYVLREGMNGALQELIAGNATASYSIGNRSTSVTRANLKDLADALRQVNNRIDELEALLSGRSVRARHTHSYVQPAAVFWTL